MRIATFVAVVLLVAAGVTTSRIARPAIAADPTATPSEKCGPVFVGGKGVVDSCSSAHNDSSRVYPRKAGVPANGCADCPDAKAQATPIASTTAKPQGPTRAEATPNTPDSTAPIDIGQPPAPGENCDRVSYPDICVPTAPPYLTCLDIRERNFRVRAPDPHNFDPDGNGIGCEQIVGPSVGR